MPYKWIWYTSDVVEYIFGYQRFIGFYLDWQYKWTDLSESGNLHLFVLEAFVNINLARYESYAILPSVIGLTYPVGCNYVSYMYVESSLDFCFLKLQFWMSKVSAFKAKFIRLPPFCVLFLPKRYVFLVPCLSPDRIDRRQSWKTVQVYCIQSHNTHLHTVYLWY